MQGGVWWTEKEGVREKGCGGLAGRFRKRLMAEREEITSPFLSKKKREPI